MRYVIRGAKDSLKIFVESTRKYLLGYFIFTIISLLLDLIGFASALKNFGGRDSVIYTDFSLMYFSILFSFLNWYYLLWVLSFVYKMPKYVTAEVVYSLLGFVSLLTKKLD